MAQNWEPDDLGEGYEKLTLPLTDDDEGNVVATLVRYCPPEINTDSGEDLQAPRRLSSPAMSNSPVPASAVPAPPLPVRTVIYFHGWSDYFFQTATAEFFNDRGIRFYALDLRKYGRSLRPHQTPGYVANLATYDDDIAAAFDAIREDLAERGLTPEFGFFAHSTGGLTASLWADRHPGRLHALMLNSAWLEVQGSYMVRDAALPLFDQIAKRHPLSAIPNVDLGFNYRTISAKSEGEWTYNEEWRPPVCFPVRAGWLKAVLSGHASVADGLSIDAPVLSMTSARSMVQPLWNEEMHHADVVLEAPIVAERSVTLAPTVTVARFDGGLHDLILSEPSVRQRVYAEMAHWIDRYWPEPEAPIPTTASASPRGLTKRIATAWRELVA